MTLHYDAVFVYRNGHYFIKRPTLSLVSNFRLHRQKNSISIFWFDTGCTCITDPRVLRITRSLRLFVINLSQYVTVLRVQRFLCRVQCVYVCMITGSDSLLSSGLIMHVFDVRFLLHVTSPTSTHPSVCPEKSDLGFVGSQCKKTGQKRWQACAFSRIILVCNHRLAFLP